MPILKSGDISHWVINLKALEKKKSYPREQTGRNNKTQGWEQANRNTVTINYIESMTWRVGYLNNNQYWEAFSQIN